jgi:hypothetical protein
MLTMPSRPVFKKTSPSVSETLWKRLRIRAIEEPRWPGSAGRRHRGVSGRSVHGLAPVSGASERVLLEGSAAPSAGALAGGPRTTSRGRQIRTRSRSALGSRPRRPFPADAERCLRAAVRRPTAPRTQAAARGFSRVSGADPGPQRGEGFLAPWQCPGVADPVLLEHRGLVAGEEHGHLFAIVSAIGSVALIPEAASGGSADALKET